MYISYLRGNILSLSLSHTRAVIGLLYKLLARCSVRAVAV